MNIVSFFSGNQKYDPEVYRALLWKKPDQIEVYIKKSDDGDGYFAKLVNFKKDNVVTQAATGQELIDMVNAAMYDYLDIPAIYRDEMGYFLPPEKVRDEMKLQIPKKYLDKSFSLVKV